MTRHSITTATCWNGFCAEVEHQLSEPEEQIIIEIDQFGVNGKGRTANKWLNTRIYEVTVFGRKRR
jgi:hypothetical protein